jgi:hypothetical protein
MFYYRCIAVALVVVALTGAPVRSAEGKIPAAVKTILEKADAYELFSLDPGSREEKPKDTFQDWKVLGKTRVDKAETRKQLVAALEKGITDNPDSVANCFEPRHGIRATHQGKTVDLVICFRCAQIQVFLDGKRVEPDILTWKTQEPVFDQVLKDAKVPLAPKGEK